MTRNQKRKIKRALLLCTLAGFVIGGALGYGVHFKINKEKQTKKKEVEQSAVEQKEALGNQPESFHEKTEIIIDETKGIQEKVPEVVPETVPEETKTVIEEAQTVPEEVQTVPDDFKDAVFIGDSRTDGLLINTSLYTSTFYTANGLMVNSAKTDSLITLENGSKGTILDALRQHSFKRVYVMFGINELGWYSGDVFKKEYLDLIQKIKEIQPEATIYIQSILPVTAEKSKNDKIYNNDNVRKFNGWIQEVTTQEQVTYVDVAQVIADANGDLPSKGSNDGVHLTKDYYVAWLEYLKTIPKTN